VDRALRALLLVTTFVTVSLKQHSFLCDRKKLNNSLAQLTGAIRILVVADGVSVGF
jgi:hypothetical protein